MPENPLHTTVRGKLLKANLSVVLAGGDAFVLSNPRQWIIVFDSVFLSDMLGLITGLDRRVLFTERAQRAIESTVSVVRKDDTALSAATCTEALDITPVGADFLVTVAALLGTARHRPHPRLLRRFRRPSSPSGSPVRPVPVRSPETES